MISATYDCVIYAQALISSRGPSRECLERAKRGEVRLYISEYVISEIRALHRKIPSRYSVTRQQIDELADQLMVFGAFVANVPSVYVHPHDPDDSHYVDLAVAADSKLIISWDRHLLNLMDQGRPDGKEFRKLFPHLSIVTPEVLVQQLRADAQK